MEMFTAGENNAIAEKYMMTYGVSIIFKIMWYRILKRFKRTITQCAFEKVSINKLGTETGDTI